MFDPTPVINNFYLSSILNPTCKNDVTNTVNTWYSEYLINTLSLERCECIIFFEKQMRKFQLSKSREVYIFSLSVKYHMYTLKQN